MDLPRCPDQGRPQSPDAALVDDAVAQFLAAHRGGTLAIGFSGGHDSAVLTDACVRLAPKFGVTPTALHVHHGLSPNADAWAAFAQAFCTMRNLRCEVVRVEVVRTGAKGLEAEARRMRYAALGDAARAAKAMVVALAHHRDDQAETILLQLLRGAGPPGLAAMPALRSKADGVAWARPLLSLPRSALAAYARTHGTRHIDDESNTDTRRLRNALRHEVMPLLARIAPGSADTLARAANNQADAARLLDDLAALDAAGAGDETSLWSAKLTALPSHRARNLLRWFLRMQGLPAPSAARLEAMLMQLRDPRADAAVRIHHGGRELGIFRGRIIVHDAVPPAFAAVWTGETALALPHGTLTFVPTTGAGLAVTAMRTRQVTIRSRAGGERLRLAENRPRRSLKALLQEAGIPSWQRAAIPLLFVDGTLASVPGIGVDHRFCAAPAEAGFTLAWTPLVQSHPE